MYSVYLIVITLHLYVAGSTLTTIIYVIWCQKFLKTPIHIRETLVEPADFWQIHLTVCVWRPPDSALAGNVGGLGMLNVVFPRKKSCHQRSLAVAFIFPPISQVCRCNGGIWRNSNRPNDS